MTKSNESSWRFFEDTVPCDRRNELEECTDKQSLSHEKLACREDDIRTHERRACPKCQSEVGLHGSWHHLQQTVSCAICGLSHITGGKLQSLEYQLTGNYTPLPVVEEEPQYFGSLKDFDLNGEAA
jgi:ribosomal protein S27E